ncbi:hypothetical protein OFC49_26775, partial [Escherichia coli]|nr:hypothetical protein [Escherichia coli]
MVYTTWYLSIEKLKAETDPAKKISNERAIRLLNAGAYLVASGISCEMMMQVLGCTKKELSEALKVLKTYSFIHMNAE